MEQINFPFEQSYDRRATPVCSTYRPARDGLIERFGKRYVIYGHWHKLFGCWFVDESCSPHATKEILPDWPIFFAPPQYVQASQISALHYLDLNEPRQLIVGNGANLSFASYLQTIPTLLQKLVLPYGAKQWLALDLCHQIPSFWRFLFTERETDNLGYTGTCFAALFSEEEHSRTHRRKFGEMIAHQNRQDVLRQMLKREFTRSEIRIISKLSPDITWEGVKNALEAISSPNSNAAMRNSEQVSPELVQAINNLPANFVHPNLSILVDDSNSVEYLSNKINCVIRNITPVQVQEAAKAFGKLRSIRDVDMWAANWMEKGKKNISYPPLPFKVEAPLRPIENFTELEAEGRLMRNCVADFFQEVFDRDLYFFHWGGEEPATICFMSTPSGEWRFAEALGYGNTELSPETLKEIMSKIFH